MYVGDDSDESSASSSDDTMLQARVAALQKKTGGKAKQSTTPRGSSARKPKGKVIESDASDESSGAVEEKPAKRRVTLTKASMAAAAKEAKKTTKVKSAAAVAAAAVDKTKNKNAKKAAPEAKPKAAFNVLKRKRQAAADASSSSSSSSASSSSSSPARKPSPAKKPAKAASKWAISVDDAIPTAQPTKADRKGKAKKEATPVKPAKRNKGKEKVLDDVVPEDMDAGATDGPSASASSSKAKPVASKKKAAKPFAPRAEHKPVGRDTVLHSRIDRKLPVWDRQIKLAQAVVDEELAGLAGCVEPSLEVAIGKILGKFLTGVEREAIRKRKTHKPAANPENRRLRADVNRLRETKIKFTAEVKAWEQALGHREKLAAERDVFTRLANSSDGGALTAADQQFVAAAPAIRPVGNVMGDLNALSTRVSALVDDAGAKITRTRDFYATLGKQFRAHNFRAYPDANNAKRLIGALTK